VKSAQGRLALNVVQTCVTGTMFCALLGCAMMDATKSDLRTSAAPSPGVGDQVRGLDLSPRFPTTVEDTTTRDPSQPLSSRAPRTIPSRNRIRIHTRASPRRSRALSSSAKASK